MDNFLQDQALNNYNSFAFSHQQNPKNIPRQDSTLQSQVTTASTFINNNSSDMK